jgi:hypothetical protein
MKMTRLAFAIATLALGLAVAAPARADFGVIRFERGVCTVWTESHAKPEGTGWRVLWYHQPTREAAEGKIKWGMAHRWCHNQW